MKRILELLLCALCLPVNADATNEPATADAPLPSAIEVYPPAIELSGARDFQSIVVRSRGEFGVTTDWTASADVVCVDPQVAGVRSNRIYPTADGESELRVSVGSAVRTVAVKVTNSKLRSPVSFRHHVMPVISRSGCNNGSCHGSAGGQDGFHLSLFGYDPEGDFYSLTRELPGRRVNLGLPEESLVLSKALGKVPHTGGARFNEQDSRYADVIEWLRAGAPNDASDVAEVVRLEIFPQDIVLQGPGSTQHLAVRAHYSDGTDRDVTNLATLISNNEASAAIDDNARVVAAKSGEVLVMARFGPLAVASQVIVIPAGQDGGYESPPAVNYIDRLVDIKLKKLRIRPAGLCSDEVFLRRSYLDIIGLLPTATEYAGFMSDDGQDKRARLVDELLLRKEFVEVWVMKWAERLQMRSTKEVSYKAMLLYYNWLQHRIASNVAMDEIVREILASRGGTFTSPATNFYQLEKEPLKLTENVAQAFMGVRIQCAQCHNHPFDRWTMDDYYGFAAFFAQVGRKAGEDPRETIIFNQGSGETRHPVDNRIMPPRFLGGELADLKGRDRRAVLADWLTAADNHLFAENIANFVWAHFFGRGIVEPVDDARISNPPANAQLLAALADKVVEYDFDLRRIVRDVCNSRTYQQSTRTNASNETDERNFSHAAIRRIRAEILLDCISSVTQTPNKFRGLPLGARAVQISDGNTTNYFLTTFGRARRESVCTCEVTMEPSLSQALHLINGETVNKKIKAGKVVVNLLASGATPDQVIERLYVLCLTRQPTGEERKTLIDKVNESPETVAALEDLFWALLNSKEFMLNH